MTPADVYLGRAEQIRAERDRIKRMTIANRRLQHRLGSITFNPDVAEPLLLKCSDCPIRPDDGQPVARKITDLPLLIGQLS